MTTPLNALSVAVEKPRIWCPGCDQDAPEGTYPPSYDQDSDEHPWWCHSCLHARCKEEWESTETYKRGKAEGRFA